MTTPFSELAMRIAEDINGSWECCNDLPRLESAYLKEWFKPTYNEMLKYNHLDYAWLAQPVGFTSNEQDNNFRILILLMAEQHWLEYENE